VRARSEAVLLGAALGLAAAAAAADPSPSFVVFLTDDQRFDTLWAMPLVQQELAARGVHFEQAFVTTPQCCPFRASFLAGGYLAQRTGVRENQTPNGAFQAFSDVDTLATRLQAAGYATGLFGKYMNGYEFVAPYVSPGWTRFEASTSGTLINPFQLVVGSTTTQSGMGVYTDPITQYGTDAMRDRALAFLGAHASEPVFLYLSFDAPHAPATPAAQDAGLFADHLHRGRGYGEADVSDKPPHVQVAAALFPSIAAQEDEFQRNQLRSLQAADRAVQAVVERVGQLGRLDDTVFFFTSDNGYLWGEHHLVGKTEPYEESIRVPLVVVMPGVAPRVDDRLVAVDLDVPATILDLAGLSSTGDGTSLVPLLAAPQLPGRSETLIEQARSHRVWSGLRVRDASGDWKYVEDSRGSVELYDLASDPYELENLAMRAPYQPLVSDLAARLAPQKGLAITTHGILGYVVGSPYSVQIQAWGGVPPYTWSLAHGALPAGLSLDPLTGVVSGVPVAGSETVTVRVEDASTQTHHGGPQRYDKLFTFARTVCSNGLDDDGDGLVDRDDPACASLEGTSELSPTLECDDGLDNDGDGLVDRDDPQCLTLSPPREAKPEKKSCGLGAELVALAALASLRARARSRRGAR
jgi:arylsulfatase A-like enzyme